MRIVAQTAKRIIDEGYDIRFHLFSGNGTDVAERLDKGLIDFGLFVEGADLKKYDSIRLPVSDTWGVLMRRDNPLAAKKSVKARDLAGVPLFISKQAADTNELSGWFDADEIKITGTYNLLYNASLMADEGVGCVLCLDKIINLSEDSNLCFRPLSPKREARLDIVWKRYQVFSKASELFLDKLREICTE